VLNKNFLIYFALKSGSPGRASTTTSPEQNELSFRMKRSEIGFSG